MDIGSENFNWRAEFELPLGSLYSLRRERAESTYSLPNYRLISISISKTIIIPAKKIAH